MVVKIYYVIFIIIFIYGLYFALTGIIGLLLKGKNTKLKNSSKKNFMAILIPARNEEKVLRNLIESLKKQNYDSNFFEIYILINNSTDRTKEIAKNEDVKIITCSNKVKTKGDVLKEGISVLNNKDYIDAYVVFDADNVVDKNYLMEMNKVINNGYKVAQGNRLAKNPSDNWLSGSYTLFYLFQNAFFNYSRMSFNSSASINGTGFMVKKSLIQEIGFNPLTLTEDMEFSGICALNNIQIYFAKEAITYDEYPTKFLASWRQRKRWSSGINSCSYHYFGKLLKNFFKTGNLASLDMALVYLGPVMQVLSFMVFIFLIIFRIMSIHLTDILSSLFNLGWLFFIITYIISIIISIILLKWSKIKPSTVIKGILLFFIFVFTWIPINIMCFINKETTWKEIKHERNIKISEMEGKNK